MPLIDVSAINEELVQKKRDDPLLIKLTTDGQTFRLRTHVNTVAFLELFRQKMMEYGVSDAGYDRALAGTLHDLVVDEDRDAYFAAVVAIEDPVDSKSFAEVVQRVFDFFLKGNPTPESSSSSPTPSSTGSSSEAPSSRPGPVYG